MLRLFGQIRAEISGQVLDHRQFGGVKARQILEILAVHRGRTLAKSSLAEMLWPDQGPASADATIETHVSLLRRAIGFGGAVETAARGYRLGRWEFDLDSFDELVVEGSLSSLMRAVALASGEVAEHDPEAPWFQALREHYAVRLTEALSRTGQLALEWGEPQLAVDYGRRALERDPLRETDYQTLIAGHYLMGDPSQSLRSYERCRLTLRKHLQVDPGSLTNALHRSAVLGLPIELVLGTVTDGTPRALVLERDGERQALLVRACAVAGCTSELVWDVRSALARLAARHFDIVVVSATMAAAIVEGSANCPVVVASPKIAIRALVAAISVELSSSRVKADDEGLATGLTDFRPNLR